VVYRETLSDVKQSFRRRGRYMKRLWSFFDGFWLIAHYSLISIEIETQWNSKNSSAMRWAELGRPRGPLSITLLTSSIVTSLMLFTSAATADVKPCKVADINVQRVVDWSRVCIDLFRFTEFCFVLQTFSFVHHYRWNILSEAI